MVKIRLRHALTERQRMQTRCHKQIRSVQTHLHRTKAEEIFFIFAVTMKETRTTIAFASVECDLSFINHIMILAQKAKPKKKTKHAASRFGRNRPYAIDE